MPNINNLPGIEKYLEGLLETYDMAIEGREKDKENGIVSEELESSIRAMENVFEMYKDTIRDMKINKLID